MDNMDNKARLSKTWLWHTWLQSLSVAMQGMHAVCHSYVLPLQLI